MPLLAVPEENTSRPLDPAMPLLPVRMVMEPLLVAVPSPLIRVRIPPVAASALLEPLWRPRIPPSPLVPLPTVM